MRVSRGMQEWINTCKSVNVTCLINRMKTKLQNLFIQHRENLFKNLILSHLKENYLKRLSKRGCEKLKLLALRLGKGQGCMFSPSIFTKVLKVSQEQLSKKNKKDLNRKRSKNFPICLWLNLVYRKPWISQLFPLPTKKTVKRSSGHKIGMQKSIAFLYILINYLKGKLRSYPN